MVIQTTIDWTNSPKAMARDRKRAMKEAMQLGVEYWWRKYLPEHFTVGAHQKYNYEARTIAHMKRKAARYHHKKPLVFSGRLEREVRRNINLSGTSNKATGRMPAPPYLHKYVTSKPIHKAEEMTRVTESEMQDIGEYVTQKLIEILEENRTVERAA